METPMIAPGDLIDIRHNGTGLACPVFVIYVKDQNAVSVLYQGETRIHHLVRTPEYVDRVQGHYTKVGKWKEVISHEAFEATQCQAGESANSYLKRMYNAPDYRVR
jgi:hypothetical protein